MWKDILRVLQGKKKFQPTPSFNDYEVQMPDEAYHNSPFGKAVERHLHNYRHFKGPLKVLPKRRNRGGTTRPYIPTELRRI